MNGVPVWLASLSYRDRHGRLIPSERWINTTDGDRARRLLFRTLHGVGDEGRQRLFRMPITLCLHRALTDDEVAGLPGGCAVVPQNLAGGGLEILWETIPGGPSTQPCADPGRQPIDPFNPDLYLLTECGACESCRARAATIEEARRG